MTETPFTGVDGRFVQMPPRNVVPKPMQKPHPPLWVACSRRDTILLAAEKGIGALTFAFIDPEEAEKWVSDYEQTLAERCVPVGLAVNPNIACVTQMMCHPDEKVALDRGLEGGNFFGYSLGHYYVFGEHRPGSTDVWREYHERRGEVGYSPEVETALRQERLGAKLAAGDRTGLRGAMGTPAQVREFLERFEQAGVDQVIFVLQAGKNRHEHICESLELFGREVLPAFKERDEAQVKAKDGAARPGGRRRAGAPRARAPPPRAAAGLFLPRHAAALGGRDRERGDARVARALRRSPGQGHQGESLGILGGWLPGTSRVSAVWVGGSDDGEPRSRPRGRSDLYPIGVLTTADRRRRATRVHRQQGCGPQTPSTGRRPGQRPPAHGGRGPLLHRHPRTGVGGDQGAPGRGLGAARRPPGALRLRRHASRRGRRDEKLARRLPPSGAWSAPDADACHRLLLVRRAIAA